jgi:hypothetical protein
VVAGFPGAAAHPPSGSATISLSHLVLDAEGNILTDARYSEWRSFDNVRFPKHIEINRPRDEYAVVVDIVKMDINKGVSDDKFVLNQPEGSVRQVVGEAPSK